MSGLGKLRLGCGLYAGVGTNEAQLIRGVVSRQAPCPWSSAAFPGHLLALVLVLVLMRLRLPGLLFRRPNGSSLAYEPVGYRCEVDMVEVKVAFQAKYRKSMEEWIKVCPRNQTHSLQLACCAGWLDKLCRAAAAQSDTSGKFQLLLLTLVGAC